MPKHSDPTSLLERLLLNDVQTIRPVLVKILEDELEIECHSDSDVAELHISFRLADTFQHMIDYCGYEKEEFIEMAAILRTIAANLEAA